MIAMLVPMLLLIPVTTVAQPTPTTRAVFTKLVQPYFLPPRFSFEVDGMVVPNVQSVQGLENFAVQVRKGSDQVPQLVPGRTRWSKITLKRGMTTDNILWDWFQQTRSKGNASKTCALDTTTKAGQQVHWVFHRCWPSRYEGVTLSSKNSGHASEKVEISYESVELK